MKKGVIGFFLTVFLTVILCGCSGKKAAFDYGTIGDGIYRNEYFGMTMQLPVGWNISSREDINELTRASFDVVTDNPEMRAMLEEVSEVDAAVLFLITKVDTTAGNASMQFSVENLRSLPGIRDGGQYLVQAVKTLEASALLYSEVPTGTGMEEIGGEMLYTKIIEFDSGGMPFYMKYYATVRNKYALMFNLTYHDPGQLIIMESALRTLGFDK